MHPKDEGNKKNEDPIPSILGKRVHLFESPQKEKK